MKKLIVAVSLILTCLSFAACGSTESSSTSTEKQALANTAVSQSNEDEDITDSEIIDESSALDKAQFEQIPEDALSAFEYMSDRAKTIYPSDESSRSYGYMGTLKINGEAFYKFTIFNDADDSVNEVAVVAVNGDCTVMYEYNAQTGDYTQVKTDDSEKAEKLSWCEKTSEPFVAYLSAGTTSEIVVEKTTDRPEVVYEDSSSVAE